MSPEIVAGMHRHARAWVLHGICSRIESECAGPGARSLRRLFAQFSNQFNGCLLDGAPGRVLRLSASTLRRRFYRWRAAGNSAEALLSRYPDACLQRRRATGALVVAFSEMLHDMSGASAYRKLAARGPIPVTYSTLMRHVARNSGNAARHIQEVPQAQAA